MTATHPKLASGSLINYMRTQWPVLYKAVEDIIGDTGTIIPLLDPDHITAGTTMTTREHHASGLAATFTATEAPTAFDKPANLSDSDKYQGIIPFLSFNGSDEGIITPDDTYWTRDDSGATPVSWGAWVRVEASADVKTIMAKWDANEAIQEWDLSIDAAEKVSLTVRDDSAAANGTNVSDAAISTDVWHSIVVTYDGSGGADPLQTANSIIYVDGVAVADTSADSGTYVAMENGTSKVSVGAALSTTPAVATPFLGDIAGGPLSPFYTQAELTAAAALNYHRIGKAALAL